MSYRFDELGWHQFERLIQALLKAELGLGVEAWGGHSDLGRDAYCKQSLCYPDRSTLSAGPFLFQAKFVLNSTAAGADPKPALQQAVNSEAKRIQSRLAKGTWLESPKQYSLFTNVPMTPARRTLVKDALSTVLTDCHISVQGAGDIAAWLDSHPALRLSFPELLGLRDLEALLARPMDKVITERSRGALKEAEELAPVFVKTKAYQRSLRLLHERGFVLLDGPPEVGKTAIAHMIGLAMATTGWELVDCRWPEDILQKHDAGSAQIFLVDDALGRTEYHVDYGFRWEMELPTVLRLIDSSHWLIWTSRKHILVRGLERMDLNDRAQASLINAANPVDASVLTEMERARMLYRHAKAQQFPIQVRRAIRYYGRRVISDKAFTPERLRRLIDDVAENVSDYALDRDAFAVAIRRCLTTASKSIYRVFDAFPENPRWILIAAAELRDRPSEARLYDRVFAHRPRLSYQEFSRHLDLLDGTFLKRTTFSGRNGDYVGVDWVHPSYRDVVIERVSHDWELQAQFWRNASPTALGLAFSEAGGAEGKMIWAWATCPDVFVDIERLFLQVIAKGESVSLVELLSIVAGASRAAAPAETRQRFLEFVPRVIEAIKSRWLEAQHIPSLRELNLLVRICDVHDLDKPVEYVTEGWLDFRGSLIDRFGNYAVDVHDIDRWLGWVQLLGQALPDLWGDANLARDLVDDVEGIQSAFESEAELDVDDIEAEYLEEEVERVEDLFNVADSFYAWAGLQNPLDLDETPWHELSSLHSELQERLEPEPEYRSSNEVQRALDLEMPEADEPNELAETVESVLSDL